MSEKKPQNAPFMGLGTQLKRVREQHKESMHEASGAVEIDVEDLQRIEKGLERPSEDILLLMMDHYQLRDQEAEQLWDLAGYEEAFADRFQDDEPPIHQPIMNKQMVMFLAMDVRTMYSDGLDVGINQAGLTLNFTQAGMNNQRLPVGRIGMSYEQANQVLKTLESALLKAKYLSHPPRLPAPKRAPTNDEK